jgi:hypothetical protein
MKYRTSEELHAQKWLIQRKIVHEGKPNARDVSVCFVLDLHKNVRCFHTCLENFIQEGVDIGFETKELVGPVSIMEMMVPFFIPRGVGRGRKFVDVEHKTVHGVQAKMHPVKQDQEVIFLCENLEVVHQRQTGVIYLR